MSNTTLDSQVSYNFLDHPNDSTARAVKIISGPYAGVVYAYEKLTVNEDTEKDCCTLSFVYDIIDQADCTLDTGFEEYIGDILNDILANYTYNIGKNGK